MLSEDARETDADLLKRKGKIIEGLKESLRRMPQDEQHIIGKMKEVGAIQSDEILLWHARWLNYYSVMQREIGSCYTHGRKMDEQNKGERKAMEIFSTVFQSIKTAETTELFTPSKSDPSFEYDIYGVYPNRIVVTKSGIGTKGEYAKKLNILSSFDDLIPMVKNKDAIVRVMQASNRKGLMKNVPEVRDFLNLLPESMEVGRGRVVVPLPKRIACVSEYSSNGAEHMHFDAQFIVVENKGNYLSMTLKGIIGGEEVQIDRSELFFTAREDASKAIVDSAINQMNGMIAGEVELLNEVRYRNAGNDVILKKAVKLGDKRYVVGMAEKKLGSLSLKDLQDPNVIAALMQLEPCMPQIVESVKARVEEYKAKMAVLVDSMQQRFQKQLLASAL